MLKQSPSRNQRSKGFKVKDAIQICVLLATCFWLLYQAKLTYAKKNASLERAGKMARLQVDDLLKLGRKGLNPRLEQELAAGFEKHEDEDEDEDDEIKLKKNEEAKETSGDDEMIDREKTEEEEPEQLEDLIDEDDGEKEEASKGVERDNDDDQDVTSKNEALRLRSFKEEN